MWKREGGTSGWWKAASETSRVRKRERELNSKCDMLGPLYIKQRLFINGKSSLAKSSHLQLQELKEIIV